MYNLDLPLVTDFKTSVNLGQKKKKKKKENKKGFIWKKRFTFDNLSWVNSFYYVRYSLMVQH